MARWNYPVCKAITLVWEGGTSNHKSDPGGFTSRGVTAGAGAGYRKRRGLPPKRVDLWTSAEVDQFYHDDYWNGVGAELLPYGVDLAAFDAGVMSGPSRASKWLQRAAGARQDGNVGAGTRLAVASLAGDVIVRKLCGYRLGFVQGLGTFKVFGKGWSRRIADIEAKGVSMWLRFGAGVSAGAAADQLTKDGKAAADKAAGQSKGAAGTGSVGGGATVGDLFADGSVTWLLIGGLVLMLIAVGLVLKSRQNKARAEAYAAEAEVQSLAELAGA